ncbi:unnamed protein product [Dovyalis caffra]|uniref:Uncharacterized protein n=1 Tax=Dovyalis caffra TaxID=77055 RepID=A0AAV1SIA1_9ROSI|nr:unnamed protein product [Dovyalis caffra]
MATLEMSYSEVFAFPKHLSSGDVFVTQQILKSQHKSEFFEGKYKLNRVTKRQASALLEITQIGGTSKDDYKK